MRYRYVNYCRLNKLHHLLLRHRTTWPIIRCRHHIILLKSANIFCCYPVMSVDDRTVHVGVNAYEEKNRLTNVLRPLHLSTWYFLHRIYVQVLYKITFYNIKQKVNSITANKTYYFVSIVMLTLLINYGAKVIISQME
jgi:hypothetical protein